MINKPELRSAIEKVLTEEDLLWVDKIVEYIITVAMQSKDEISSRKITDEKLHSAIKRLENKQVVLADSVITFGQNNQTGDISIRDVAGRDIININIHPITSPHTTLGIKQSRFNDTYSGYERGLDSLLAKINNSSSEYFRLLSLQQRLEENIRDARTFGDSQNRKSERAEIILQLNQMAITTINLTFNELCQ